MSLEDISDIQQLRSDSDYEANRALNRWYQDKKFNSVLENLVGKSTNPEAQADLYDLKQESIIGFWRHIKSGQFREECSLRTLIIRIAENRWKDIARTRKRFVSFEPELLPEGEEEPVLYFINEEKRHLLRQLLTAWKPSAERCIQIFVYRLANHAFEAIEDNLGMNPGNARKRYADCINRFHDWLAKHPGLYQKLIDQK